jgi:hypothetical protein
MSLNESIVEDAALEWFLLRRLLRQGYEGQEGFGGQVGVVQYRFASTLIPAFSQREKEEDCEAIRRLNPVLSVADAEKSVHNPERQTA